MTQPAADAQAGWWPGIMADVAAAVARRSAAVSGDVYEVILREVPQLRDDIPVLALLASSVDSNVWVLRELAQQPGDAYVISAAALGMSGIVAGYIDQVSEEMVAAYTRERANWLLNRSATRGTRIRHLLSGEPVDVGAAEATLGYRLCQYHVGLVCWAGDAAGTGDEITRLEHAVGRDPFDAAAAGRAVLDTGIHVAFGDAAKGTAGFRLTHQQALAAQSVALAAGLADDDEHHARLRGSLLVFLQNTGSYKTTAERLMLHKNTVQYRIRKAEESLGRPVGENRHDVELALRASHWLGSLVLRPAPAGPT